MSKKAILALENGSVYEGEFLAFEGERVGWVTFYTGVVGYQEVMSNPVNAGRIVVMTYPLIGNYGVAEKFMEGKKCWAEGMIIKERTLMPSNWQAEGDFEHFLKRNKVLAIERIDTRSLMVELRDNGEQFGIISTRDFHRRSLKRKIEDAKVKELDVIKKISIKKTTKAAGRGLKVVVLDIGVTNSLLTQLEKSGCEITLIPYATGYGEIMKLSPEGLIISDGPEMDKSLFVVIDTVKRLLGKFPLFALGTGCQVLALAMGAKIERMSLGHHGLNYPVLPPDSLKGRITVQNHSCVINETSLKGKDVKVTWRNINDMTVEGIESERFRAIGIQFFPASPGFDEVNPILKEFIKNISREY